MTDFCFLGVSSVVHSDTVNRRSENGEWGKQLSSD